MAEELKSEASCLCSSCRKTSRLEYLSSTSKLHTFCSLRKHTGHKNKGCFRASAMDVLSFMRHSKNMQCCSPNPWHSSWLITCWNITQSINGGRKYCKGIVFIIKKPHLNNELVYFISNSHSGVFHQSILWFCVFIAKLANLYFM